VDEQDLGLLSLPRSASLFLGSGGYPFELRPLGLASHDCSPVLHEDETSIQVSFSPLDFASPSLLRPK